MRGQSRFPSARIARSLQDLPFDDEVGRAVIRFDLSSREVGTERRHSFVPVCRQLDLNSDEISL
jgi:hypothetical protein